MGLGAHCMDRQNQRAYLNALGVEIWVSRANPEFDDIAVDVEAPGDPSAELNAEALAPANPLDAQPAPVAAVAPVPQEPEQEPQVDSVTTVASPAEQKPADQDSEPNLETDHRQHAIPAPFSFNYQKFGRDTLVIAGLQQAGAPGFSGSEHLLFNNIIYALGWSEQQAAYQVFHWPIDSSVVNNTEAALHELLNSFLEAQIRREGITRVLILGKTIGRYLMGAKQRCSKLEVGHSKQTVSAVCTLDLVTMLQNPQCKSEVWHDLTDLL